MLRHNYIGTEHLLLGLLREEEGIGARVLGAAGVDIAEVRAHLVRIVGVGDEVETGQIPFTPRAKNVLEQSLRESLALGHKHIGTEHILFALVGMSDGVAAEILRDLGVRADTVSQDASRMVTDPTSEGPPVAAFEPQSPPLAPEVGVELERLSREQQKAVQRNELDRAASLRDRRARLVDACRHLIRVWNEPEPFT